MLEKDIEIYKKYDIVSGIDEAGRGPLAGPLVVAGVTVKKGFSIAGLNDSKKISDSRRRLLYPQIKQEAVSFYILTVEETFIEKMNILAATLWGMYQVCKELPKSQMTFIDGNRVPIELTEDEALPVIKGDSKLSVIAAASILAKVYRDDLMMVLDKKYPQYGFLRNKGYATREHLEAIDKYGITPCHRKNYAPVAQKRILI